MTEQELEAAYRNMRQPKRRCVCKAHQAPPELPTVVVEVRARATEPEVHVRPATGPRLLGSMSGRR